jgi:hypothetical protein
MPRSVNSGYAASSQAISTRVARGRERRRLVWEVERGE